MFATPFLLVIWFWVWKIGFGKNFSKSPSTPHHVILSEAQRSRRISHKQTGVPNITLRHKRPNRLIGRNVHGSRVWSAFEKTSSICRCEVLRLRFAPLRMTLGAHAICFASVLRARSGFGDAEKIETVMRLDPWILLPDS
jgi:hypothetical protein